LLIYKQKFCYALKLRLFGAVILLSILIFAQRMTNAKNSLLLSEYLWPQYIDLIALR